MSRIDHLEMGDWEPEQPRETAEEAGVIDHRFYFERANDAFADENYKRALSYYSRALQYDINLEEAWLGQLRCLIELHELQEAVVWSDRALERFPDSPQILAARGAAESRLGRSVTAIGYSDGAFATSADCTPYMWAARGEALIPINTRNAQACFEKAVELAPDDWAVRAWIARSYLVRGQHHQALEHLKEAIRLNPNRFNCWYWIGRCWEALGVAEEAKRAYGRSLAIRPGLTKAKEAIQRIENRGLMSKLGDGFKRLFSGGQLSEG